MTTDRIAPESELTSREKFQAVPPSANRERSSNLADSGKKVLPGVKRSRDPLKLWQQLD